MRGTRMLSIALVLAGAGPVWAWGNVGHVTVNEAAARGLDKQVPQFMRDKVTYLGYLGPEPDRWRSRTFSELNKAAAPDHFIDLELATGVDPKRPPDNRHDYARLVTGKGTIPSKVGFGPYRVAELAQKMEIGVASLLSIEDGPKAKQKRKAARQAILYVAGVLGHYVADLANPHHCTIHYNGWAGKENPEGFPTDKKTHARFESRFVERVQGELKVKVSAPARARLHYAREIWKLVVESNGLTKALYRLDRDGAFTEGNEQTAVGRKGLAFAQARMVRGATLLRDMWTTAWVRGRQKAKTILLKNKIQRAIQGEGITEWLRISVNMRFQVRVTGKVGSHDAGRKIRELLRRMPEVKRSYVKVTVLY